MTLIQRHLDQHCVSVRGLLLVNWLALFEFLVFLNIADVGMRPFKSAQFTLTLRGDRRGMFIWIGTFLVAADENVILGRFLL